MIQTDEREYGHRGLPLMTKRSVPACECRYCNRIRDDYMVHPAVWKEALRADANAPGRGGHVCFECLETRLGRALVPEDFTNAPINRPILLGLSSRWWVSVHGDLGTHEPISRGRFGGLHWDGRNFVNRDEIQLGAREGEEATVAHLSVWTASEGGEFVMGGTLDHWRALQPGDSLHFGPGELSVPSHLVADLVEKAASDES